MSLAQTYYKVLSKSGAACLGGSGQWHLPKGKRPGKWMPKIADPKCCERGYHLVTRDQLTLWLGPTIWEAEGRGAFEAVPDKTAFEQARLIRKVETWTERTARLFAADCAERVLPIFERKCPDDDRPREAIEAARAFARGKTSRGDLQAAADAVWWAVLGPGWTAARDAAYAASAATRACARGAAGGARDAQCVARRAERKWQTARLWEYLEGKE